MQIVSLLIDWYDTREYEIIWHSKLTRQFTGYLSEHLYRKVSRLFR